MRTHEQRQNTLHFASARLRSDGRLAFRLLMVFFFFFLVRFCNGNTWKIKDFIIKVFAFGEWMHQNTMTIQHHSWQWQNSYTRTPVNSWNMYHKQIYLYALCTMYRYTPEWKHKIKRKNETRKKIEKLMENTSNGIFTRGTCISNRISNCMRMREIGHHK